MRFRWLMLALVAGTGLVSSTAHAASNTEYLAIRNQTPIAALPDPDHITDQFPTRTGQTIELEGQVTGIFTGDNNTGFLLRIDPQQTLILYSAKNDGDIAVGNTLHVLARIPAQGTVLESQIVTTDGSALARSDLANLRTDATETTTPVTDFAVVPNSQTPVVRYYRVPQLTPQPPQQRQEAPPNPASAAANTPMSQQTMVVRIYAQRIQAINNDIDDALAQKIAFSLLKESDEHGVDPRLIFALVTQESRFNPRAVSPSGAMGLGQLMPGTAAGLGVHDPFDVSDNMCGTVRYIAGQLSRYGRLSLALAAYNAGPGNVSKYGGVPPFRETQNYVSRIWKHYAQLSGINPDTGEQIATQ